MYITEVLLRLKEVLQVLILQQDPYRHLNAIVLFLWTTRDQFLSQFPLYEATSCFMRVVAHTPNSRNPIDTNLTTHGSS